MSLESWIEYFRPKPPPPPPPKSIFSMDAPYKTIVDLALRLGLVCLSAYISARILASVMDPDADKKKQAKGSVDALMKSLGIEGKTLKLNEHEIMMATQLINTNKIDQSWEDVGGQDEMIQEIRDTLILPMRLKKGKTSALLTPPKGVLLYGPPGCGKTLIAKALSKATGARFMNFQVSSLTDKWYGESQKHTTALFSLAQKVQPVIIFIDEIDSFLRSRSTFDHECTAMMKAQFMTFWDGFMSDPTSQVIIVGATNRPEDVDPAILRRMPARFEVKRPDVIQRQRILEVLLRNEELEEGIDLTAVAADSEGFSGSDLREVCRLAAVNRMKDLATEQQEDGSEEELRPLRLSELLEGVQKMRRSKLLDDWATLHAKF